MPIHKRLLRDGITTQATTVISAPRSRRDLREDMKALRVLVQANNRLSTFDGRVADLEQFCRRHRSSLASPAAFGSRAWYADTILGVIGAVRHALARGDVQLALSEAVEVGAWATEAQAKFGTWADLLLREARIRKNRELSPRGGAARRAKAAERDNEVILAARRYRSRHPDVTPEHSTRALAKMIARDLDMKEGTVRGRLRTLGLR
jgi:hypothetical protein